MILLILFIIGGFFLLLLGAIWIVKGASSLAKRFHIPEIVIGLTVIALGTTSPELTVNIISSIRGLPDIVFGNIIGSNLFNTLMILGAASLIYPLQLKRNTSFIELPFAIVVSLIVLLIMNDSRFAGHAPNFLDRRDGIIMIMLLLAFLFYTYKLTQNTITEQINIKVYPLMLNILILLGGFASLILGGRLVVFNAVKFAHLMGLSEKVIGLTIVATGTSLPEFATAAVAAYRKHPDIAIGNIIGANILNVLLILGVSSMIRPAPYSASFNLDFIIMIGALVLLFFFLLIGKRHNLQRWEGGIFVILYVSYVTYLLSYR